MSLISFQSRIPRKCLSVGREVDPDHADVVVHDEDENDADSGQVPLHLQLERSQQNLAWNDWNNSNGHQQRSSSSSSMASWVCLSFFLSFLLIFLLLCACLSIFLSLSLYLSHPLYLFNTHSHTHHYFENSILSKSRHILDVREYCLIASSLTATRSGSTWSWRTRSRKSWARRPPR